MIIQLPCHAKRFGLAKKEELKLVDFTDMTVALIFAWWGEALWVERLDTSGPHKKTMRAALIGDGLWGDFGLI